MPDLNQRFIGASQPRQQIAARIEQCRLRHRAVDRQVSGNDGSLSCGIVAHEVAEIVEIAHPCIYASAHQRMRMPITSAIGRSICTLGMLIAVSEG